MRLSIAKLLVGKVAVLDMLGGARITTKVVDLVTEEGKHFLKCDRPSMIILREAGSNQFQIVGVVPYGIPDFQPAKDEHFDIDHIIMAREAIGGLAEAYAKATSSIVPANASTPLPDMGDLAAAMGKLTAKT